MFKTTIKNQKSTKAHTRTLSLLLLASLCIFSPFVVYNAHAATNSGNLNTEMASTATDNVLNNTGNIDIPNAIGGSGGMNLGGSGGGIANNSGIITIRNAVSDVFGMGGVHLNSATSLINSGTITVNSPSVAQGMFLGGTGPFTINNSGTIYVTGTTGAYGIHISGGGNATLDNTGYIYASGAPLTDRAEVYFAGGGTLNVNSYATSLRNYAVYGKIFDIAGAGRLHFNNTRFIARPGLKREGFEFGRAYSVNSMHGGAAGVTGAIGSVETEIDLIKATLSGTTAANQTITLTTNVNSKNDPALKNGLDSLNYLLNRNNRLDTQIFIQNYQLSDNNLSEAQKDEITRQLHLLMENNHELQIMINSTETAIQNEVARTNKRLEPYLMGMNAAVNLMKEYAATHIFMANAYFSENPLGRLMFRDFAGVAYSASHYSQWSNSVTPDNPQGNTDLPGAIYFKLQRDYEKAVIETNKFFNNVPADVQAMPEFQAMQKQWQVYAEYSKTLDPTGGDAMKSKTAAQQANALFNAVFSGTELPTGISSGSLTPPVTEAHPFIVKLVDEFYGSTRKNADWSVFLTPYGNATNNNDGSSYGSGFGFAGGITRVINDKFSLGTHFDLNSSYSKAENFDTNSNTFSGSLGFNANYNLTPQWYVGGSITGSLSQTKNNYQTGNTTTFYADNVHGGGSFTASLNSGYAWQIDANNTLAPEIGLSYVYSHTAANNIKWDNGGSFMNIENDAINYSALYGNMSLRWLGNFIVDENNALKPFVSVGVRQNLSANPMTSSMKFAETRFNNESTPDLTTFTSTVGVEWVYDNFSLNLNYNGAYGREKTDHGGALTLTWSF